VASAECRICVILAKKEREIIIHTLNMLANLKDYNLQDIVIVINIAILLRGAA